MNLAAIKWSYGILWRLSVATLLMAFTWYGFDHPNTIVSRMMIDGLWLMAPVATATGSIVMAGDALLSLNLLLHPSSKTAGICAKMTRWRMLIFMLPLAGCMATALYANNEGIRVLGGVVVVYLALAGNVTLLMVMDSLQDNARHSVKKCMKERTERCSER